MFKLFMHKQNIINCVKNNDSVVGLLFLNSIYMKKIIIFDFNRTLYDPDNNCLIFGARFVLRVLVRRGFLLYVVSSARQSRRQCIDDLGIGQYFAQIIITKEKCKKDFQKIIAREVIDRNLSFVIGDRVRKEISIGNTLGMQTIWVKAGKFSHEEPRRKIEQPTYIVRTLRDILSVAY